MYKQFHARRQDKRWSTNILQWCPRDLKRPGRRSQVTWSEEIRKKAGVNLMTKAEDRKHFKNLGETYTRQWIEKD